ncbi:MAG: DNA alkylation repair protein [Firmicutes bacterium]|nr:DNA alkylation repair protein [Bacillota bacterium]
MNNSITERLFLLKDDEYRLFNAKLIPNIAPEKIIGVRTPALRKLAKELTGVSDGFLSELPHKYFEENQLHAFIISEIKDFDEAIKRTKEFLPYIDNWATCDQLTLKAFSKNRTSLPRYASEWIKSDHTYTIRFGIGILMKYFLDDLFCTEYSDLVAGVVSDEYYVNMMSAWYFATALAKQYDQIICYLTEKRLSAWVHNMSLKKAAESFRIPDERKVFLRTLRIK